MNYRDTEINEVDGSDHSDSIDSILSGLSFSNDDWLTRKDARLDSSRKHS